MWTVFIFKKCRKNLDKVLRRNIVSASPLDIKRAVVLTKMTRYDVERHCHPNLSPEDLEKLVRCRGSNFESLMQHHQRHKNYEEYILKTFKDKGIDTKLLKKSDYSTSWIEWCDAVFPIGGDGTFLLAASQIRENTKPIIGFNSDPQHSEGFLCLPKKHSKNVKNVLLQLEKGSFSWIFRTRIRVTVKSKEDVSVKEPQNKRGLGIHRIDQNWYVKHMSSIASSQFENHLPILALNEVFVGEKMSAQVSYFEMQLMPEGKRTRVKSSGLCLSTGTGSTSWNLSINRLTPQCVSEVLKCAGVSEADFQLVTANYNDALLFDPEAAKMCYTIRDLISAGVWPSPPGLPPRGFAEKIWVCSHCQDAWLVIDGGASYSFNDGCEAFFELKPEDTLRTVLLNES